MPDYPHKHLEIPPNRRQLRFQGNGRGKFLRRPLSREHHAARLQRQLANLDEAFEAERQRREESDEGEDFGLILNIDSAPGFPLKLDSLEKAPTKNQDGIYLLNVRRRSTDRGVVTSAAILVPFGQLKTLTNKVAAYADEEKDSVNKDGGRTPKNADLLSNIKTIGVAALKALWTDPEELPESDEPRWWELWISRAPRAATKERSWRELFEETRIRLELEVNRFRLLLPDNEIVLVQARKSELENSIDLLNTLTEVRKIRPCSIDLSELEGPEQYEWIEEALTRIHWPEEDAPAVCLLDTGVNRGHPLIENLLTAEDLGTVLPHHGAADHPTPAYSHGTPMAGMAAYDDLRKLMLSSGTWEQVHRLESVKVIHEGDEHNPENYGEVTRQAISTPEIAHSDRSRVFCMALTQRGTHDQGKPSSWSAAVDASTAGMNEQGNPRRVMFISAGNIRDYRAFRYLETNRESPIENPAQSWNAITVGAMTRRTSITEKDDESRRARAIGSFDELSPFSRTSASWDPKWPIKPEIVLEGGNLAQTESGAIIERESLEPISTASNFRSRPLCNMNATSAATASASRIGAILMKKMPGYWAETYRGLVVHSAKWTSAMLGPINPHETGNSGAVQQLLRMYGFGMPNTERLFGSGESGVTMIIQDYIQPYDPGSPAGKAKLGYFNLHDLPWPRGVFDEHPDVELALKVTLSYFIEPNPGSRCWEKSLKYRYASHLLRFSFKRATEDEETFRNALEKRIQEDEQQELEFGGGRAQADPKWAVGPKLRGKAGSLVQDIWKGSPAELAEMGQVAVYPAKGWFATRSFPEDHESYNCHQRQVRYSLILSIDAEQEIGLYSSVSNLITLDA